uniref:Uncharacterized protein n=1 Tax=Tanacetum cinerariifolium TaxID=118510 RepID=A0A699HQ99_TANCI|nr:hypothetical protein [Tanacetum cinerariifolium]
MWPVILTTYNLPLWLCMKESSFMMKLLILGPESPGKDIDVYLRPLIEDLKVLWDRKGVETIDVASGQKFNMRAMVLWTINDFLTRISLFGWSGQGYNVCRTCNKDTPSVHVLSKVAYVGHKRFLKKPHKWRSLLEFNGETDDRDPPKEFGWDEILAQLDRLPTRVKGKHLSYGGVKIKRNVHVELNWTKQSVFYELEYWSFLSLRHNLDIMHVKKNMLEAILNTLLMNDKSKDTGKARQHLESLNDLDNVTLHIDGQSTKVDAPPDIIDVVDEDDDIIDDEDALPHDLADSDNKDLINVNDDDVAWSHGGDGGGEDRPPPHYVPSGYGGCFANRGKGKRKPNLGGRAAGRLNTRDKTRNPSLKEITDTKGSVPIQFELRDKQTLMPLGEHAAHWSSYIEEVIRGVPLYHPSWLKTQFDLRPHMISPDWTEIHASIQQHLQKAYNTNKCTFKAQHWVINPMTETYNVEKIRRARPQDITADEWDKYIQFWNDPRNITRAAQNRQNRAKSTVISRQGSRSLARLRYEMRQSSTTQGYPSLIDTFFVAHTVNGEFLRDEDRHIYEDMRRLEAKGTYTDDEINPLARGAGVAGAGTMRRVPTIKMTRMRMAMAILSYVIYGIIPGDMSSGNICHCGTNYLTEKYVGPTVSLGIVVGEVVDDDDDEDDGMMENTMRTTKMIGSNNNINDDGGNFIEVRMTVCRL